MGNTIALGVAFKDPESLEIESSSFVDGTIDGTAIGSTEPSIGTFAGIFSGTSTSPISKSTATSINQMYGTANHTSGDMRELYVKLNFTGAGGSGEALRAFSTVAAAVATGGTVNGAHISLSVNSGGSVSGAGNAARFTLGAAASVTPGGTLSVIQVDSDIHSSATMPSTLSFMRFTNSNTGVIPNLFRIPTALAVSQVATESTHTVKCILEDGTVVRLLATTVAP